MKMHVGSLPLFFQSTAGTARGCCKRRRSCLRAAACAVAVTNIVLVSAPSAQGQTWNLTGGQSWATNTNWNPQTVPNAVGAAVVFPANNASNRTITNDAGTSG